MRGTCNIHSTVAVTAAAAAEKSARWRLLWPRPAAAHGPARCGWHRIGELVLLGQFLTPPFSRSVLAPCAGQLSPSHQQFLGQQRASSSFWLYNCMQQHR